MKYNNLVAGIILGGIPGMLFLISLGHVSAGFWLGGLCCGLSFPSFYAFIRELGDKEEK